LAGPDPAIYVLGGDGRKGFKTWMPGSSPGTGYLCSARRVPSGSLYRTDAGTGTGTGSPGC